MLVFASFCLFLKVFFELVDSEEATIGLILF